MESRQRPIYWQRASTQPHILSIVSILSIFILAYPDQAMAQIHISDLPSIANKLIRLPRSIQSADAEHASGEEFNELLPYVMASPDQQDAGSCLYMAITGIAEWWLARLNPNLSRTPDGPIDLSERYIMNIAGMEEDDTALENWRTDSIFLFNRAGRKSMLNKSYRYTKGWYIGESYSDRLIPANSYTPNAQYGTLFNWIDLRPQSGAVFVRLPEFDRDVLFADPENNQWNIGVAPDNIVEKVKHSLKTRKAPVLVVYNHDSYWHAVYIIGFSDKLNNNQCEYTESFRKNIAAQTLELEKNAAAATDPTVKKAYELRALKSREAQSKIELAYLKKGGCTSSQGVFYIRDSIYPDYEGPLYDYDLSKPDEDAPYSKKIVYKEYDWLRYFANHISSVYPKKETSYD